MMRKQIRHLPPIFFLVFALFLIAGRTELTRTADAAPASQADVEQPKYALLVGITNYKSPTLNKIDGCENNVPLLAQTLTGLYGFKKENVVTLMNEAAGKAAIINGFRSQLIDNARKANQAGKQAVIVYYFCGHGSQYPDQDGDENDGLDETFVAYDSRTGGTPDILDDEIDDLKAELRPFTKNTTLIFESCHSGTGSRGDAGDTEFVSEEADPDKQSYPKYVRKFPPSRDEDSTTYVEIAASASTNTAKSETKDHCNCDKPYSLMTKALVEALNRTNYRTTYRGLMNEVEYAVSERSNQEPQVEGNRDTLLFGGAAKRTKPYIEIAGIPAVGQVIIKAGRIHGLKVGSQVTIYSSESATDTGDKDWLTNGIVKDVRDFQSLVQLPSVKENPKVAQVAIASHVVLTSPVFGGGPVLVSLETAGAASRRPDETALAARIQEHLKNERLLENEMISIVQPQKITPATLKGSRGVLRLKMDKFSVAFPARIRDLARVPKPTACTEENGTVVPEKLPEIKPDTEVYYLDDGNPGGTPLYGKFFLPDDKAADDIAAAIRNYAFRTNLESLTNNASTLPSQISVTVNKYPKVEIVQKCVNGELRLGPKTPPNPSEIQSMPGGRIPAGTIFNFSVKNISGDIKRQRDPFAAGGPIFVTALYLRNDGDIDVIYPKSGARDPLADGLSVRIGGYIASKPGGAEHLIVIVSTSFVDFSMYDSTGLSRDPQSLLEQILKQSGTRTRDAGTLIPDTPDAWGVRRLDLDIVD